MYRFLVIVSVVMMSLFFHSCAEHIVESAPTIFDDLTEELVNGNFADIQAKVFTPSCAVSGCHDAGGTFPELTAGAAYRNIVNISARGKNGFVYVKPGDPDASYLYLKIIGADNINGERMPRQGVPLSASVSDSIRAWIFRGALDDSGQAPPDTTPPPTDGGNMRASFTAIQDSIFNLSCAFSGCHGGTQNPELTQGEAYDNIVEEFSLGRPLLQYINPGQPDSSYLYLKLIGDPSIAGQQMPRGGDPLKQSMLDSVRVWIENGAIEEDDDTMPSQTLFSTRSNNQNR